MRYSNKLNFQEQNMSGRPQRNRKQTKILNIDQFPAGKGFKYRTVKPTTTAEKPVKETSNVYLRKAEAKKNKTKMCVKVGISKDPKKRRMQNKKALGKHYNAKERSFKHFQAPNAVEIEKQFKEKTLSKQQPLYRHYCSVFDDNNSKFTEYRKGNSQRYERVLSKIIDQNGGKSKDAAQYVYLQEFEIDCPKEDRHLFE